MTGDFWTGSNKAKYSHNLAKFTKSVNNVFLDFMLVNVSGPRVLISSLVQPEIWSRNSESLNTVISANFSYI